ncbi:STM4015 family protein [Tundrisphaera sp. TA3]|uniref:STM4015 family protein n=1 Tax=Tundrisphaera sp. TA3 TaxID=3435775 RepID=UPI003EB91276
MTISENAEEFAGLPVRDYDPEAGIDDPKGTIYRLRVDYDSEDPLTVLLARFLEDPAASEVPGLVIGAWQGDESDASAGPIVEALVAAREALPNLRALFLGDITSEENEISWIQQSDVTPLFDAYPNLEHFRVRGGSGLAIGKLRHGNLRSLVVESGGLDAEVVRGIAASDLPRLEHLELWLGTENYGGNVTPDDLAPILRGDRFPALKRLGLRDAEGADRIAEAVAQAPILARLDVLDLSLGDLGDEGAMALVSSPYMPRPSQSDVQPFLSGLGDKEGPGNSPGAARLTRLDIHHHYVSDEVIQKLKRLGIEIEAGDRQEGHDWGDGKVHRYIAVSE